MALRLQNHLTLAQNVLFNAVFWMPVSDSWDATCWGAGMWGNYTFNDYKIRLIELISIITCIVQICNWEIFISTIMHGKVT